MEEIFFSLSYIPMVLIFITVFLVCYLYLRNGSNLPPGPRGLPFIGNMLWMSRMRKRGIQQHLILAEASKAYGDIVSLTVAGQRFVFLHGYDTIRDAFVKNADVLSDRPSWLKGLKENIQEGKGVMWQSGPEWKVLRKFVIQTLRDFGVGKTSLEEKIMREVDAATESLNAADGKPTDIRLLTSMMITNVIYGIVFAKRFDYDDEELHTIIENLDTILRGPGVFSPEGMVPSFLLKRISPEGYKHRQSRIQVIRWVKEHIYGEISNHESTFDNENIRDFIDLYLQAKKQHSDENVFNSKRYLSLLPLTLHGDGITCMYIPCGNKEADTMCGMFELLSKQGNMFRVIMDLFLAGSETTSNTINWCILYMQEYPDIQKKCRDEISEKFGDKAVTWADKGSLPYVEATLLEIQRMANIAPLSLPHTNEVDTTIGGYFVPRRSLIIANLYSASIDPRHWDQPEVFNPSRFMEGGKLKNNPALIPFSTGPRICLGESLAKMEMFLIFTNLLQRFTFCREDDNVKHSFGTIFDQLTSTPLPYKTRALKRA